MYLLKRHNLLVLMLLLTAMSAKALTEQDLLLLDSELERKTLYETQKQENIHAIRQQDISHYDMLLRLFDEYKSYSYDTAYWYVDQLYDETLRHGDNNALARVQLGRAFLNLSSGLFKESSDIFLSLNPAELDTANRIDYYTNYARLLYDMADYVSGQLSQNYTAEGHKMSEHALALIATSDTVLYWLTAGLYAAKLGEHERAIQRFVKALQAGTITEHQRAIAYSSMAALYNTLGDTTTSEHYWVMAAVSDLRSCTKETVAMGIVAQILYRHGDLDHASRYIYAALDDATRYNARHRQLSISRILPIIEQSQLAVVQAKNRDITRLSIMLYILLGVLLLAIIMLINRLYALRKAKETIQTINRSLMEANRIREEYIGSTFCQQSDLFSKLEKYQRYVRRKAQEKRPEELVVVPQYIDANIQRRNFYKQFDQIFLRIFPNFVQEFNALLRPEEQIVLGKNELLNTELRIFALIRLGIDNNEQIAAVLDYSINTIYTYKTRIRNRSNLSNEQFQQAVMAIPSF
ncbi:MAG: hypothetical protein IJ609_03695 [Paludibacteraceae bacterium]|nr:hypothetical protein [Paludibacteraceae bacterium]MBR1481011.1 hypothetical protein [Paludibacteraceae bacterium]